MSQKTNNMAKNLVRQMTLEEKISQMLYQSPAIERLGIPDYNWWNEALHGVARAGVATVFPQAIGLAASFDKELLLQIADAVSTEGRGKFNEFSKRGDHGIYKGLTFWAPNINIFRDPRWGRGHETFGEDPVLTAELGCAYIEGLQGDDSEHLKSAACAKHFAVHSGPEAIRHEFDARVTKRELYDTYLYAFKRCVKVGNVEAVMGAYNRVNGEPACGSKTLLKDILRDEWGFKGHVVSDCWAIKDFHENHGVTKNAVESAALAVNNGCDLNCGNMFLFLKKAIEEGLILEETITNAVERLIDVRIRLGMMKDYASPYDQISYDVVESKKHVELSLEAAKRSTVLLKNQNSFLPLDKTKYKKIAVIGPNANSRDALVGNYIGTSSQYITPLEGIQKYLGDDIKVSYAEGCHLYREKVEFLAEPKDRFAEAVIAAEQSDLVILCLGMDATIEGEEGDAGNEYASGDKLGLKLPGLQEELMEAVARTGRPIVLLLSAGSAIDLSKANEYCEAIMNTWYPGARGGKAIAEMLFGECSPSGKLPITFYANTEELPDFCDYSMHNRTYRYAYNNVQYPFGYGLGYSKIIYQNATVEMRESHVTDSVKVTVEVKNMGSYSIHESVQVYVKFLEANDYEPGYQLKSFKTVHLKTGEVKKIDMELNPRDFAYITENGRCVVRPGEYCVSIGGQQPDELSRKLTGEEVDLFFIRKYGEKIEVEY